MRLLSNRLYKSGTKWCVWRWTDVDNEFITRLHVLKTPFFALCLHWIKKPDPEPFLHDHPVSFLSFILRGSYTEYRGGYYRQAHYANRRWFNWFYASEGDAHRITSCDANTITIAFMGPKTRDWGYHTPDGWVYWKDYSHAKYRQGKTQ